MESHLNAILNQIQLLDEKDKEKLVKKITKQRLDRPASYYFSGRYQIKRALTGANKFSTF